MHLDISKSLFLMASVTMTIMGIANVKAAPVPSLALEEVILTHSKTSLLLALACLS